MAERNSLASISALGGRRRSGAVLVVALLSFTVLSAACGSGSDARTVKDAAQLQRWLKASGVECRGRDDFIPSEGQTNERHCAHGEGFLELHVFPSTEVQVRLLQQFEAALTTCRVGSAPPVRLVVGTNWNITVAADAGAQRDVARALDGQARTLRCTG
jgi:hypothetical protein